MKKLLVFTLSIVCMIQVTKADVWECLSAEQADIVTKIVKKGNFVIRHNYDQAVGTFELIKLTQVDVLACSGAFNDPAEIHSIRIVGNSLVFWSQSETGCFNATNASSSNTKVDDLMALNYTYVYSKDKNKFILVCDLYANYEWTQCKSFDAPGAKANGIKDVAYKKIAK